MGGGDGGVDEAPLAVGDIGVRRPRVAGGPGLGPVEQRHWRRPLEPLRK